MISYNYSEFSALGPLERSVSDIFYPAIMNSTKFWVGDGWFSFSLDGAKLNNVMIEKLVNSSTIQSYSISPIQPPNEKFVIAVTVVL